MYMYTCATPFYALISTVNLPPVDTSKWTPQHPFHNNFFSLSKLGIPYLVW